VNRPGSLLAIGSLYEFRDKKVNIRRKFDNRQF
jgi:hypothetical protein